MSFWRPSQRVGWTYAVASHSRKLGRSRRCFADQIPRIDPLRILFCGADDFSAYSLKAIHDLHARRPDKIASIDVVCRPDKRVGRGFKQISAVPLKGVAQALQLPLHQIDTFTGWTPPIAVDLVVAVSFGLLVPPRILSSSRYGGLNIHPSLLPDLRGPAPIQHTLLSCKSHTGVSLQTMHPTRFDHGMILSQTPSPGIIVPVDATPDDLIRELGIAGANMLRDAIDNGLFVSPTPLKATDAVGDSDVAHAPKITPQDRQIDWTSWSADRILRSDRVVGRLWDDTTYQRCCDTSLREVKRVTFHGPWRKTAQPVELKSAPVHPGFPVLLPSHDRKPPLFGILSRDGDVVIPTAATIEGEPKYRGLDTFVHAMRRGVKDRANT